MLALGVALEARTFVVGFLTDPLGARAVPLFLAGLLALGGAFVALRPATEADWPDYQTWRGIGFCVVSFVVFAASLYYVGFIVATIVEFFVLAVIFGGPPRRSLVGAVVFTGFLYVLFAYLLGLSLPLGALFRLG